jgi:hypothetical protein
VAAFSITGHQAVAQSSVEQNSNVVGVRPEGNYRGIPAMQDNAAIGGMNPILQRNVVCAWNASGDSNDPMGPGGGIYMRLLMDMNTESGFRHFSKRGLDQIYRSTGSQFAESPESPPFWEDKASLDPANPDKDPLFRTSWMDARNVRGQIFTEEIDGQLPYTSNGPEAVSRRPGKLPTLEEDDVETLMAERVEDFNPVADFCSPVPNPGAGVEYFPLNNRIKDFDIYGAV